MSASTLELDQDDMTARLTLDSFTGQTTVFSQRKGITENDIQTRLGALNQKNGLVGLVLIVLMPTLSSDPSNTPAPMYFTRYSVQVIDWPALRRTATGVRISAETMAERVRQILHFSSFGRGQSLFFDGMEPLAMQDPNQISYVVHFKKKGADTAVAKVNGVAISPLTGTAPQTLTMTCSTVGALIWYTVDGSYPSSLNPTAVQYTAPFSQATAATIRAAAELAGSQQGDPAQAILS